MAISYKSTVLIAAVASPIIVGPQQDLSPNENKKNGFKMESVSSDSRVSSAYWIINKKSQILEKLNQLGRLKDNWDRNHAKAISSSIIEYVRKLIDEHNIICHISPTGRGSIQLEHEKDEDNYIEIEVFTNEALVLYAKNGKEVEKRINLNQITDYVALFRS